jgi:hypothetical protein
LRESPLPGRVVLSYEREPCYFAASALEGPFHQTIVAREPGTGEVLACANRSVRLRFVDGEPRPVGYMSQLRFHPRLRGGMGLARFLSKAFAFFHTLHEDGRAPFYLVSVVAGNNPARRLLTGGLPGFPRLRVLGRLETYAIHLGRPRRPLPLPRGLRLEPGTEERLPALLDCLDRNGRRCQLAPCWTAETLGSMPGLSAADFSLALDGERVVGCLAAWDQSAVKQLVVRGYSGALAAWRPLLNLVARLPPPGAPLRSCWASHRAIDHDDREVFAALLRAVYNSAVHQGHHYLTIGFGEADPLRSVLAGYRTTSYLSDLYLAAWEDGEAAAAGVDGRPPDPEIAVL